MFPSRHPLPWYQLHPCSAAAENSPFSLFSNVATIVVPFILHSESSWTLHRLHCLTQLEFEGNMLVNLSGCIFTGCAVCWALKKYLKNFSVLSSVLPTLQYNPFALRWGTAHKVIASYAVNRVIFAQYLSFFMKAVHGRHTLMSSSKPCTSSVARILAFCMDGITLPLRIAGRVIYNSLNNIDLAASGVGWEINSLQSTACSLLFRTGLSHEIRHNIDGALRRLSFSTDFLNSASQTALMFGASYDMLSYDDLRFNPQTRLLALSAICYNTVQRVLCPLGPAPGFFCLSIPLDAASGQTTLSIQHGMRLGSRDVLALGLALFATRATFNIIRKNWRWVLNGFKCRLVDTDMDEMGILGSRFTDSSTTTIFSSLPAHRREFERSLAIDQSLYPTYWYFRSEIFDFLTRAALLGAFHVLGATVQSARFFGFCEGTLRTLALSHSDSNAALFSSLPSISDWSTCSAMSVRSWVVPAIFSNLLAMGFICWTTLPESLMEALVVAILGPEADKLDAQTCEGIFKVASGIPSDRLSIQQLQKFSEFAVSIAVGGPILEVIPNSTRCGACLMVDVLQVLILKKKRATGLAPVRFLNCIEQCPLESLDSFEEPECTICLSGFDADDSPFKFKQCGHTFHIRCLSRWLAAQFKCPLCRRSIEVDPLPSTSESSDLEENLRTPVVYSRRTYRGFSPCSFRPRLTRQETVQTWINEGFDAGEGGFVHSLLTQGVFLSGLTDLGWILTRGNTCSPKFDCTSDARDYIQEVLLADLVISPMVHEVFGNVGTSSRFVNVENDDQDTHPTLLHHNTRPEQKIRNEAAERQKLLRHGNLWLVTLLRLDAFHKFQIDQVTTNWHRLVYNVFAFSIGVYTPLL